MIELIIDDEKGRRKVDLSSVEKLLLNLNKLMSSKGNIEDKYGEFNLKMLEESRKMDEDQLRYLVIGLSEKLRYQLNINQYTRESYFNMQGIAKKIVR
ncbi:hypothetical protein COU53_00160 [Candidatus Pacearchaeota archaeon CG10_big_fil_rev_8_21_14_0_10_30_48]|nr:MAG: hypothetical protein COU53_00160 [Candidatus Pacearchaeota archaeon CG10_big_fil_rev_8_21_14_0_10_30_48]